MSLSPSAIDASNIPSLEHPAIPTPLSKALVGQSFDVIARERARPLPELVEIVIRAADAIGYAHSRGIVHRALTAQAVVVANFRAVYVGAWDKAVPRGFTAESDPRIDVAALGELLLLALADTESRSLARIARRCIAAKIDDRFSDGGEVADALRAWTSEGIAVAQGASSFELAWLRLRQSQRVRAIASLLIGSAILALSAWLMLSWRDRYAAEQRIATLAATVDVDRPDSVANALNEVRALRQRLPNLVAATDLETRLQTTRDLAVKQQATKRIVVTLTDLLQRTRTLGPDADTMETWRETIRSAGLGLYPLHITEDVARLRTHPQRAIIISALAYLWHAEYTSGAEYRALTTATLIAEAGATSGWQALGRVLARCDDADKTPLFPVSADADSVLAETEPSAIALAFFAPDKRLTQTAREHNATGDFWSLIVAARADLAAGDIAAAERNALIASGVEPDSVQPILLFSYAALARGDRVALARHVARGLAAIPNDEEFLVLNAIVVAKQGLLSDAQAIVDKLDVKRLRLAREHQLGRPIERSLHILGELGLRISASP